jgi:hypothetical protein
MVRTPRLWSSARTFTLVKLEILSLYAARVCKIIENSFRISLAITDRYGKFIV